MTENWRYFGEIFAYLRIFSAGPGPDYSLSNMLSAVEKITELGLDLSGRAVDACKTAMLFLDSVAC